MNRQQQEQLGEICSQAYMQALTDKNAQLLALLDRIAPLDKKLAAEFTEMRAAEAELHQIVSSMAGKSPAALAKALIAFAGRHGIDFSAPKGEAAE